MAKVWKVPSVVHCTFPMPQAKPYVPKNELYSLFYRTHGKTYKRIATTAYPQKIAYTVFKSYLTKDADYTIRLIRIDRTLEAK